MDYTIPALLFSGIFLFFNGYTIRYNSVAKLIRNFNDPKNKNHNLEEQIIYLKKSLGFVKWIQFFSVLSLLSSTTSILMGFLNIIHIYQWLFFLSIIFFLLSLIVSVREIYLSTFALKISLTREEE